MERLSFASLTLSAMTSHKRLKLRQCTNCECVINGVWEWVEECARGAAAEEPAMRGILDDVCLSRNSLATSISARLARKLSRRDMPRELIEPLIREALTEDQNILSQIAQDLIAIVDRDPACRTPLEPLLFYKGFHAITTYRISHWLWQHNRTIMALQFQSLASEVFAVDIHPAATIGCGILLDNLIELLYCLVYLLCPRILFITCSVDLTDEFCSFLDVGDDFPEHFTGLF